MDFYDTLFAKELSDGGGITPTGSLSITENDTYDVTQYASAVVNVPNPSTGTKSITENGTYDVTDYASASVNVPNPSTGTLNITENGTYDVTEKASAVVDVSGGGGIEYETGTWTPSADTDQCDITFTNNHSVPPSFVAVMGDINTLASETTFVAFTYTNIERIFGIPFYRNSSSKYYGSTERYYRNSNSAGGKLDSMSHTTSDTSASDTSVYDPRYWCNENGICGKNGNGTDGVFKAGVTYNWIAIWYSIS